MERNKALKGVIVGLILIVCILFVKWQLDQDTGEYISYGLGFIEFRPSNPIVTNTGELIVEFMKRAEPPAIITDVYLSNRASGECKLLGITRAGKDDSPKDLPLEITPHESFMVSATDCAPKNPKAGNSFEIDMDMTYEIGEDNSTITRTSSGTLYGWY